MLIVRDCDWCGVQYEAKSSLSKFCSVRCRGYSHKGKTPKPVPKATVTALPAGMELGRVEETSLDLLRLAERENTPLGQAALVLARRVDKGMDAGSAMAAMVKQLEQTLRSATDGLLDDHSAMDKARDELAARREQRSA